MGRSAAVPSLVALVGDHVRHRWFAASLVADDRLDVRGVVCERSGLARSRRRERTTT